MRICIVSLSERISLKHKNSNRSWYSNRFRNYFLGWNWSNVLQVKYSFLELHSPFSVWLGDSALVFLLKLEGLIIILHFSSFIVLSFYGNKRAVFCGSLSQPELGTTCIHSADILKIPRADIYVSSDKKLS